MIELTLEEYLWFVDDCLETMTTIVEELGDELANTRPELPDANSPYAVLTHCLGVMEFWGGEMVAGRPIERDRDAEFRATGPVAEVRERVARSRARFVADLERLEPRSRPTRPLPPEDAGLPFDRSQAGVLVHVFHELAQHLGQVELTRDLLRATGRPAAP
ncbi:DinB family protein [Nocardioides caldifontis]|uniref:DinB family protein n=1 Tax=Nocardioides caldifontis TaxID=2588938 RepID=UPI00193A40FD|nr:DinB family protein [Nocardioides caldifontis]